MPCVLRHEVSYEGIIGLGFGWIAGELLLEKQEIRNNKKSGRTRIRKGAFELLLWICELQQLLMASELRILVLLGFVRFMLLRWIHLSFITGVQSISRIYSQHCVRLIIVKKTKKKKTQCTESCCSLTINKVRFGIFGIFNFRICMMLYIYGQVYLITCLFCYFSNTIFTSSQTLKSLTFCF